MSVALGRLEFRIWDIVAGSLPENIEVILFRTANADTVTLRLCDKMRTVKYLEQEFHAGLTENRMLEKMLEAIGKFIEYWNSPLMEALR